MINIELHRKQINFALRVMSVIINSPFTVKESPVTPSRATADHCNAREFKGTVRPNICADSVLSSLAGTCVPSSPASCQMQSSGNREASLTLLKLFICLCCCVITADHKWGHGPEKLMVARSGSLFEDKYLYAERLTDGSSLISIRRRI